MGLNGDHAGLLPPLITVRVRSVVTPTRTVQYGSRCWPGIALRRLAEQTVTQRRCGGPERGVHETATLTSPVGFPRSSLSCTVWTGPPNDFARCPASGFSMAPMPIRKSRPTSLSQQRSSIIGGGVRRSKCRASPASGCWSHPTQGSGSGSRAGPGLLILMGGRAMRQQSGTGQALPNGDRGPCKNADAHGQHPRCASVFY